MAIFIAYSSISLFLFVFWYSRRRRKTQLESYIFIAFFTFIFMCGLTHLCDVIAFYYPMYRLFTVVDFLTAVISVLTAIFISIQLNEFSKIPTLLDYNNIISQLEQEKGVIFKNKKDLDFIITKINREKILLRLIINSIDTPENIRAKLLEVINETEDLSGQLG